MELDTGNLHDSKEEAIAAGIAEGNLMEVQDDMLTDQAKKTRKVGRNDPCPCGSGLKFKKCCFVNNPLDRLKNHSASVVEKLQFLNKELEIKLAYCMTAATGEGDELNQDDFGWSPSYAVVCELREDFDSLLLIERSREDEAKDVEEPTDEV
jgi:hypothetical protein